MTKLAWPVHLTIAIAGAASIATSRPASWLESRVFQGPSLRLDQTHAIDAATVTVHLSKKYLEPWDDSWGDYGPPIEVVGLVRYDLDAASQDLRIALVTPDQNVIAEQIHPLAGAGRFQFSLKRWEPFACQTDAAVCAETLTVELDAGSVPGGVIDIEWYVRATASGGGSGTPRDLVFGVALEGGQAVPDIPELLVTEPATDEIGDGRWLLAQSGDTWLGLDRVAMRDIKRFHVHGRGAFSSSEVSMRVAISTSQRVPVELRLAVLSDEPGAGVLAEQIVTMSGESEATFELGIPDLLDCAGGACTRGFQILFEAMDEGALSAGASVEIQAVLAGNGEPPPAGTDLVLEVETPW